MKKPTSYIGTSGYSYEDWKNGVFYPRGLAANKWLGFYSETFDTVELNVTFYRLPKEAVFKIWYKRTPKDFSFSVKASRFITHIKRLKDCEDAVKLFFKRVDYLKNKVSCILWQLPPKFKSDQKRLSSFIKTLSKEKKKRRHVFEFRNESWYTKEIFRLLRDNNISLCIADWPPFSKEGPETADFVYIRRHGRGARLYDGRYTPRQLKKDAQLIRDFLRKGKGVYIYFNNDAHGYAPKNAMTLKKMLGPL